MSVNLHSFVKNIFLTLMGVFVAILLYVLFFGTNSSADGDVVDVSELPVGAELVDGLQNWQGVLWWAAWWIEVPISRYYYEYSYVPNMHVNDYVDEELGKSYNIQLNEDVYDGDNIFKSKADLSSSDSDRYTFSGDGYYSTGWF